MERFILQKSDQKEDHYVCTDQINGIVCVFKKHDFNGTQQFTMLDDSSVPPTQLARVLREMGDWLNQNHYEILF